MPDDTAAESPDAPSAPPAPEPAKAKAEAPPAPRRLAPVPAAPTSREAAAEPQAPQQAAPRNPPHLRPVPQAAHLHGAAQEVAKQVANQPSEPDPQPAAKPARRFDMPRVDAARAKAIAGSIANHGKRAYASARRGATQAAGWTARAAKWSKQQASRATSLARNLLTFNSEPRVDPLEELAREGRYTVISKRFAAMADLSEEEITAIRQATPDRRIHQAGSDIAVEGETAPSPIFIASGWACRVRVSRRGRRQIVGFLLPGDGVSLNSGRSAATHTTITALTSVETVSAEGVIRMAHDANAHPSITDAFHRLCALDDEFMVNQITRLGVSTAVERVSHLLLELHWRLAHAGLATEDLFPLPVAEEVIGDALGLRPQAVKRILSQLSTHRFISRGYSRILIKRPDGMKSISGFTAPSPKLHNGPRRMMRDVSVAASQDTKVAQPQARKPAAQDEEELVLYPDGSPSNDGFPSPKRRAGQR